jgi:hypothetical protein
LGRPDIIEANATNKPGHRPLCKTTAFLAVVAGSILSIGDGSAEPSAPLTLPDIRYHLTARPWLPLNTPSTVYLDRIEAVVRYEAGLQDASGAIIDPVVHQEWQYATPYFANALGVLLSAGRAQDLVHQGVMAMEHVSLLMAQGNGAIPQQHGNFFIAPMADALSLYTPYVSSSVIQTWRSRMMVPIAQLASSLPHNWRTYAMKGEWYRARQGLVSTPGAVAYIEDSWIKTQRSRLSGTPWNLYHDTSSDPDTFAYDAAARANLWNMLAHGYNGASAAEMASLIQRGTQSALLLQDASGQAPVGGRSGNHTWNDVYSGLGFELMAERAAADGNKRLAGQYRHAAMLALRSVDRWRSAEGYYFVTKNHFDPKLRVRYAEYSQLTNYNGNVIYHMSEAYRARHTAIVEQPAPAEIGGYALEPDALFSVAVANAGGMQIEASLRGTQTLEFNQYWTTLGLTRISRVGWDSRLGPSDGVRDDASGIGVSYAPTFIEGSDWVRMATAASRYQAAFSIQMSHPMLVRCRLDYTPRPGQTGPAFTDHLVITPDGILSTVTSTADAGKFGVNWPLLVDDGAPLTTSITSSVASVSFPGGGDQQNYIALNPSPTLTALPNLRSAYGDLKPIRVVAGSYVKTFIYPRSPGDPSAESVRDSFTPNGAGNFSTVLGRVEGRLYIGRTAAGGIGSAIDLDQDGTDDVTFGRRCGFILQLDHEAVKSIEADRSVNARIRGAGFKLQAYTPVFVNQPANGAVSR